MAARKTIFAAGALAMLATPVVHAASNEDCSNFVFMDIITIQATESCNIDFMNDPGVVAMVNAMNDAKCLGRLGRAKTRVEAEKAKATWDREVKDLGKKGACSKMTASMSLLNKE